MSVVRTDVSPASDVGPWLERASAWMFASLALQPPSSSTIDEMQRLLPSLPAAVKATASEIVALPLEEWEPEFFSVLGPSGCPACESSYERAAMASRGPLLADVAAYYEAFVYAPEPLREVPDHIAVELGFLSFMAFKIAFARYESRDHEAGIALDAYEKFKRTHLGAWAETFCAAVIETGSPHYQSVAGGASASSPCSDRGRCRSAIASVLGASPSTVSALLMTECLRQPSVPGSRREFPTWDRFDGYLARHRRGEGRYAVCYRGARRIDP